VKEKRAELDIIKLTSVRRACEFLRDYFVSLVDSMMSDKSYFSQDCQPEILLVFGNGLRGQLKKPDHANLRSKCRIYARLLQHKKIIAQASSSSNSGIKEDFGSGKAEKIVQKGKRRGKNVSQNGLIDESEDDCRDDDDGLQLTKSFGRNQNKFNVEKWKNEEKFENRSNKVCLGAKRGLVENLKNHKRVGTKDSQQNSENDDDALSYLGDNTKLSKSFGNNDSKSDHVSGKIENKPISDSELRRLSDLLRIENEELKSKWETEKWVLEEAKDKAEKKFHEIIEQNKILHDQLEALHIKVEEKSHGSSAESFGLLNCSNSFTFCSCNENGSFRML
ncbi:Tetratricopeptide, MLP1/MLP2-like protein, partial [Cynara cardunculus var. scolymus]